MKKGTICQTMFDRLGNDKKTAHVEQDIMLHVLQFN